MISRHKHLSVISALHLLKLCFRSALFLAALIAYIVHRPENTDMPFGQLAHNSFLLGFIVVVFVLEMLLRFFPSSLESMGCQKQFRRNFIPTGQSKPQLDSPLAIAAVALVWILLNAGIGVLYWIDLIDEGILILISLAYSVCDMICILFFCPFQTWFMKNKCCGSCRIYNWDYAMMFTPLVFIPHPFTWGLLGLALLLLVVWEITLYRHPERFSEATNACLSCGKCQEKLCHHKTQLKHFLKKRAKDQQNKTNQTM